MKSKFVLPLLGAVLGQFAALAPCSLAAARVQIRYPNVQIAIDALAAAQNRLMYASPGPSTPGAQAAPITGSRNEAVGDLGDAITTLFTEIRVSDRLDKGKEQMYWSNELPGGQYKPRLPDWTQSPAMKLSLRRHPDIVSALLEIDLAQYRLKGAADNGGYVKAALVSVQQATDILRKILMSL